MKLNTNDGGKNLSFFIVIILGSFLNSLVAQKEDYQWLSGYAFGNPIGYDTSWGFYFGTTLMNFNNNPCSVAFDSAYTMNFDRTNTSVCDSNGNLLFYTDGIYIDNSLDEKIENSDSLNAGYFWYDWDPTIYYNGYENPYGIYAFHNPGNANQYYIIYTYTDSFGVYLVGRKVLIALLDMSLNSGHGKVIYKNQTVLEDIIDDWGMALTRHGNGRDWWAVLPKINSECYYSILINDTGTSVMPNLSCGPVNFPLGDFGVSCFSPDGTKYVHFSKQEGLTIFDFDRCTGVLSNPVYTPLFSTVEFVSLGVAISPSNQYLYVSMLDSLYQFDLQATDVIGSMLTVGVFDGTQAPFGAFFGTQELGPDGRIYMSCSNTDTVYHIINQPDLKGDSCDFQQHAIQLPSVSAGVPSFPNYRLGALAGSACDTITGLSEVARAQKESILKVFPNPATDIITIDYGFTNWSLSGIISLVIVNEFGQIVYSQPVPQYSGYQRIAVNRYSSGIYNACIKRDEQVIAAQKFAKE